MKYWSLFSSDNSLLTFSFTHGLFKYIRRPCYIQKYMMDPDADIIVNTLQIERINLYLWLQLHILPFTLHFATQAVVKLPKTVLLN